MGAALICLALSGCETTAEPAMPRGSAPSGNLELKDAIQMAGLLQLQDPNLSAILGGGSSMEPLYTKNTVIVLAPIEFDQLESDLIVAYQNEAGVIVIHRLYRRHREGWSAIGLNNNAFDSEVVTAENLRGVVYGVLYTGNEGVIHSINHGSR